MADVEARIRERMKRIAEHQKAKKRIDAELDATRERSRAKLSRRRASDEPSDQPKGLS